jgi:hypothetical protein
MGMGMGGRGRGGAAMPPSLQAKLDAVSNPVIKSQVTYADN